MNKIFTCIVLLTVLVFSCASQKQTNELKSESTTKKPKLVVGVVIDQMRAEYLYRFQINYTENDFKRLIREGFNVKNIHYNYVPTATGPGHTSIYTGTTPANHGIVSNFWYSRNLNRVKYCAEDSTVYLVNNLGIDKSVSTNEFSRSQLNVQTTTITDELKLFTNKRSKVIGVSIKDRSAIFPAGHMADYAFWYNSKNGEFVSSSYYTGQLPKWLINFNKHNKADSLLNQTWDLLLPVKNYRNSFKDDTGFEKIFKGKIKSTFPYNLKKLRKKNKDFNLLTEVPFGNTILTELVMATVKGEDLGKGDETDFLTVSYSSTDYIGHHFGIRSRELEDTYIRMDREIERLLEILDAEVGKGNYTLFLTADHAGSDHPHFLHKNNLPGKFYNSKKMKVRLENHLTKVFGDGNYISYMDKTQIYLASSNIPKDKLLKETKYYLYTLEGVKAVFAPSLAGENLNNSLIAEIIKNSYSPETSGDIMYQMEPGWMEERTYGTTHCTCYTSDTHVPLLWYGCGIPQGMSVKPTEITQIAPTLSFLLDIPLPNASKKKAHYRCFK